MTANMLHVVVHGKPVPQGSVRSLGTGRPSVHGNAERLWPWRDSIIIATQSAMIDAGWHRTQGPLSVYGSFCFDRPQSHFTPGGALRATAPAWPVTRANGDLDKLQRAVGDALTAAGAIFDDSQIVRWAVMKQFVSPQSLRHPGVILDLCWLEP